MKAQLDFQVKQLFSESVSFHNEILGGINLALVPGNFLVHEKIFIHQYIVNFLDIVKDPHYDIGKTRRCRPADNRPFTD